MNELLTAPFITTKAHRLFCEFGDACRSNRYIGLCYGVPGIGKTVSAREYASWDRVESVMQQYRLQELPALPTLLECVTLFYTPSVNVVPTRLEKDLEARINQLEEFHYYMQAAIDQQQVLTYPTRKTDVTQLLIIDEADRLKTISLEVIRDLYDRRHIGVILIGMPGLEKRLSRYAQFYSRVGFVHHFKPLYQDEIHLILQRTWQALALTFDPNTCTEHDALITILHITQGNFRLLERLISQIVRILNVNQLRTLTRDVIMTARESLIIGV